MARPKYNSDIKQEDRKVEVALFEVNMFTHLPTLLKHYTNFIEQVQKLGGVVEQPYGNRVSVKIPKNREQLDQQLKSDQYRWDDSQSNYLKVVAGDVVAEWRHNSIKEWAEKEGLPDPFKKADADTDADADADNQSEVDA